VGRSSRSDLYSLGCVLTKCSRGIRRSSAGPRRRSSLVTRSIQSHPFATARATVSGAVEQALDRALAKSPADRLRHRAPVRRGLGRLGPRRGAQRERKVRWRAALGVGLALVALGAGLALWRAGRRAGPPAVGVPAYAASVAVLPFETIGGGPQDEYFSDGMTDEIITQLAQIPELKVISRTSVVALKGSHLTLSRIADTGGWTTCSGVRPPRGRPGAR